MKRILLGLLLGALIFGVAFAGAKVATVTNPMSANLDGGSYAITNVSALDAATVTGNVGLYSGAFTNPGVRGTIQLSTANGGGVNIDGGYEDPSVACFDLAAGSLYLRRVSASAGELWFHPTDAPCNWTRLAP